MEENENLGFDLDDIIKEFGGASAPEEPQAPPEEPEESPDLPEEDLPEEDLPWPLPAREEPEDLEQTRRIEPVQPVQSQEKVTGDTIRLENLRGQIAGNVPKSTVTDDTVEARVWKPEDTIRSEPFSEQWEPEYDEPIGEYVPPQPIQFKSRLQELKRKLIAGPEKRYYELSEKGVGRLQAAIFLSLLVVLVSAASTALYAFDMVQENRIRLMVFGQFLALLVSGLLGSYQMIDGIGDLIKKRFTLNTLLAVTFVVCFVDGILCLQQVRVPCCAAFSLQVTMSLWSTYQRRSRELSQMDTMRKAVRLDGIAVYPDYMDGKKGLLRKEGQVEDFMDHYAAMGRPEKRLNTYSFVAMWLAFAIGIAGGVLTGLSQGVAEGLAAGVQVSAVCLLIAVPATGFISQSRPAWVLEHRMHRLGTVLCGWQGVEGLGGKAVFPLTYGDMYPVGTVRMNGVKYFGSRDPDQVVAYASALATASGTGLAGLFAQVLDTHNGRFYDAYDLTYFDNGGVKGTVENETVLMGSASFMKEQGVEIPENARLGYAVYLAIAGELSGLFAVSYEKSRSVAGGLTSLHAYRGLQCVLTSHDFMLTHGFMKNKFGIKPKRFLLPEHTLREELQQKKPDAEAPALLLTTVAGLAPLAYGVTGARVLGKASRMGTVLHIIGGAVGLAMMLLLVVLGALELLTPANMFLYQLIWMIPALLITEWTRSV